MQVKASTGRGLGFPPTAEDQSAEREAEPERADGEGAERDGLASDRETLPAAERFLLLGRQLLAAPLLAQRASGAQPEVQIVEDLRGFFSHAAGVAAVS